MLGIPIEIDGEEVERLPFVAMKHRTKTCILGSGLTGLSAAYHMAHKDYVVLEKENSVGGNCRTPEREGFHFDLGGHIFYPKKEYVQGLVQDLLGDGLRESDREAWIYSHDTYTRYPFQANLYGLPDDVIKSCLDGLRRAQETGTSSDNFLAFIHNTFGDGIAKHFMIPFNEKHWRVPLDQLTTDWMGKFIPKPSYEDVLAGSQKPAEKCIGQNARFLYPRNGGIQAFCDSFLPHVNSVGLNSEVTGIDLSGKTLEVNGSRLIDYQNVISTLPLPVLVGCLKKPPAQVSEAAAKLRWNSLYVANVAVDRPSLTEKHRVYCSGPELVFHKLAFFSSYAPSMAPSGKSAVSAEVIHSEEFPMDPDTLSDRVVADLRRMGILKPEDGVLFVDIIDVPCAYSIYDRNREKAVATIREYFAKHDVRCWGRYAEWAYQNMEANILSGKKAAEAVGGSDA